MGTAMAKLDQFWSKNSVYILTSVAIAGTISAAVLAVKATPKAMRMIEEAECETKLDMVKASWTCYIPTTIVIATTIGSIVALNSVHNRKNAALAGLYSLAQNTFREYQDKVIEIVGEHKEQKVRDEVDKERVLSNPPAADFIFSGTGEVLCYDSITGRYFNSGVEKIKQVVNELNRRLMTEMFISLNDFYYELGLEPTKLGDNTGFNIDQSLLEVKFSSQLTKEGRPCLVLNYDIYPSS